MADLSELSRLHQAALEERRIVRERADDLIPSEAVDALEHIDGEVGRTASELEVAWLDTLTVVL